MTGAGIPPGLFPPLCQPGSRVGEVLGTVLGDVLGGAGVGTWPLPVTAVGSHDTASAVAGVPADGAGFAYISCGTWSLAGVELGRPGADRGQPRGRVHQRGRGRRDGP